MKVAGAIALATFLQISNAGGTAEVDGCGLASIMGKLAVGAAACVEA